MHGYNSSIKYNQEHMFKEELQLGTMKVDRDKTKRLNTLVIEGLNKLKNNVENENKVKQMMLNIGILNGEIRKVFLTSDASDLKMSIKYLFLNSMYNVTKDNEYSLDIFYNIENKSKFLHKYPDNTQHSYSRTFEKSKKYEELYNKDLSEFNLEQIDNVLHELEPLTESASHVNGRIITAYIDWCIDNNNASVENNELKEKPMSYFKRFVDEEVELYFTKTTIDKIVDDCNNSQDAVIIKLLFEGVQGNALAEIRNMKKEHVYDAIGNNNIIKLYDEDCSVRELQLEERTISLIVEAMEQLEYLKKNGEIEDESIGLITNLVDNDYVIRTSITRTDSKNRPVDKMVIYRRIKIINDLFGYKYLTAKNIVRSGIIYKGSLKLINNNDLNKDDYIEICKDYNINNWYPVKKYCNKNIIKKLYKFVV